LGTVLAAVRPVASVRENMCMTSPEWKSADKAARGWSGAGFDDGAWPAATGATASFNALRTVLRSMPICRAIAEIVTPRSAKLRIIVTSIEPSMSVPSLRVADGGQPHGRRRVSPESTYRPKTPCPDALSEVGNSQGHYLGSFSRPPSGEFFKAMKWGVFRGHNLGSLRRPVTVSVSPAKRVVNRLFAATTSGWGDASEMDTPVVLEGPPPCGSHEQGRGVRRDHVADLRAKTIRG
jgi:hypothetical protein